jgi:thiol-disulfide isomerase/thioredoxin
MKIRSKGQLANVLWACTWIAFASGTSAQARFAAPILPQSLTSTDGKTIQPDDDKRRLVVLDFFTSWCVPCIAASKKLETVHHHFAPDDLEIIGVDVREDKKRAEEFVSATKVTFPVVLDDGTLESKYKVYLFPVVLVFDRQSHLLYRFEGNDEKVGEFVAGLLRH